tara:strand:+ start:154 stop:789 length:636 start_codon:yes stop_codon:yes gene_type:complete
MALISAAFALPVWANTSQTLSASSLFSNPTQTQESVEVINNIKLKSTLNINKHDLHFNGGAVRDKFFIDLYIASLYTTESQTKAQQVLKTNKANAIHIHILSKLISNTKMQSALIDGLKQATNNKIKPFTAQIETLVRAFDEPIKQGDEFLLLSEPGAGLRVYKNNMVKETIEGESFRKAILKIWLGEDPVQTSVKFAMLEGQKNTASTLK